MKSAILSKQYYYYGYDDYHYYHNNSYIAHANNRSEEGYHVNEGVSQKQNDTTFEASNDMKLFPDTGITNDANNTLKQQQYQANDEKFRNRIPSVIIAGTAKGVSFK